MQAVILAAGMGTRLYPFTEKEPKALVPVNGVPLLVNMLRVLAGELIKEVFIVVGYQSQKIKEAIGPSFMGMKIVYIENSEYETTNNIYSFYLAKDYVTKDAILLECDLFIYPMTIRKLISSEDDCNILVSPYNPNTMNGTVVLTNDGYHAKSLLTKKQQGINFDYKNSFKTVNIYKFNRDFLMKKFFPSIKLYMETQDRNSYYELILGSLIYYENDHITITKISENLWREIDDKDDLIRAEQEILEAEKYKC